MMVSLRALKGLMLHISSRKQWLPLVLLVFFPFSHNIVKKVVLSY